MWPAYSPSFLHQAVSGGLPPEAMWVDDLGNVKSKKGKHYEYERIRQDQRDTGIGGNLGDAGGAGVG
jgi:hypothetical protein